jgi:transcription elongation factor GreA
MEKMRAELEERREKLMPELIEEVKRHARVFGDIIENYAVQRPQAGQNRNRSRIRYLERMIASARSSRAPPPPTRSGTMTGR